MSASNILSTPPPISPISAIQLPDIHTSVVDNIPVYQLRKEGSGVVLLDIIFYAGRPQEKTPLASSACAPMMREGAGAYDSERMSEEIDFVGASISVSSSLAFIVFKP